MCRHTRKRQTFTYKRTHFLLRAHRCTRTSIPRHRKNIKSGHLLEPAAPLVAARLKLPGNSLPSHALGTTKVHQLQLNPLFLANQTLPNPAAFCLLDNAGMLQLYVQANAHFYKLGHPSISSRSHFLTCVCAWKNLFKESYPLVY